MNEYLAEIRSRFDELEQRERQALLVLGSFLIVIVLYLGVWSPVNDFVTEARDDHERHLDVLSYLQSTLDDAKLAAGSGNSADGVNLITQVSRTARTAGVSPSRMQPEGDGAVSVWFEAVPFTQLMLWLERLDAEHGIAVRQITMERQDAPGQVSARLVLRN